jgi:hypothetical protein
MSLPYYKKAKISSSNLASSATLSYSMNVETKLKEYFQCCGLYGGAGLAQAV